MKRMLRGALAAASVVALTGTAMAQNTTTQSYTYPGTGTQSYSYPGTGTQSYSYPGTGTQSYSYPGTGTQSYSYPGTATAPQGYQGATDTQTQTYTYTYPGTTGTQPIPYQGGTTTQTIPSYPGTVQQGTTDIYGGSSVLPPPYYPSQGGQPPVQVYPSPNPAPYNPNPAPRRGQVPDTDAWTFNLPRYFPAVRACLRNTSVENPVIANVQERRNATVMLIGQGGTAEYSVCRTGLNGTRVRPGKQERGLPPAFYAPNGSSFTVSPDRPFQPVVDTSQRLLGWIVRTTPVVLGQYGATASRGGFDGQFIKPVTVNPSAQ